jgi:hypothetical protein
MRSCTKDAHARVPKTPLTKKYVGILIFPKYKPKMVESLEMSLPNSAKFVFSLRWKTKYVQNCIKIQDFGSKDGFFF